MKKIESLGLDLLEKIIYDPLGPAEPELALVQSDIAGIDRLAGDGQQLTILGEELEKSLKI